MKSKKRKPYKLGLISGEVQRLNMLEGAYPEALKVGQPSNSIIQDRVLKIRAATL